MDHFKVITVNFCAEENLKRKTYESIIGLQKEAYHVL